MSSVHGRPNGDNPFVGPAPPRGPVGIGGWLLLLAFAQMLATFSLAVGLAYEYLDPAKRKLFAVYPLGMYGELALNMALILLFLATMLLLFRESRHFPRMFILECIVDPLHPFADMAWSAFALSYQLGRPIGDFIHIETEHLTRLAISVVSSVIGIVYVLKSRRVRNTFVLDLSGRRHDFR